MAAETRRTFVKRAAAGVGAAMGMAAAGPLGQALGADTMFRAKFAICNETFGDWPFDRAFALAAECGYQGIEIAPFTVSNDVTDIPAARRTEIRRQAEKAGLKVAGLHWLLAKTKGFHLTHPDAAVRRKTAEYLGALARFCADLGGRLLIFGSPQQRNLLKGVVREEGANHAVEVIRAALPALEKADVTLAMEPLSPKITNFLSTAAEAVELIKRIDSPRCRLILDCNAMATESSPHADLIRRHRAHLVHFHANDPCSLGPGFGDLDFVPILAALRDIAYSGWISVEVFDYTPGPERLARESIRYMKECLAKAK
ncbi:MAG TPA: sugar phosphate isomerase/epimerase family protein [Phycisphaerae bacterium]|nr:sugar phosphate isomerase/epimerase family protein [Phycisphaerae bacterium]